MDKRKRRERFPRDFWDEFFDESFDEFFEMRKNMNKMFRDAIKGFPEASLSKKPFVYGFSVRIGPDGIPHIQQFGDTKLRSPGSPREAPEGSREPLTDIIEADDRVTITLELPGVEKKDINLEAVEDSLTIDVDSETRKYHKKIRLPENLDLDTIDANYKNGVLDIVIKRKKERPKKGKKIDIN
ncbi:archaeal heat shock protein Hsp20 [[Eubacterium] cellulosolvens]